MLHDPRQKLPADLAEQVTEITGDLTKEAAYNKGLQDNPVVVSTLVGMDVDLVFEALFDAQYHQRLTLQRFVMLSTAGVDQEVSGQLDYPDISDVKEYLNQQRYAAKLVDEAEFPYTILRPVTLNDDAVGQAKIIREGETVPAGFVSRETVAQIAVKIAQTGGYDYQSLAIC
ncbi:saccharopine dehydrogenase related protein [Levilactobacillus senmaizukei DSM 21775 = NBRC 103853]|uniref:Saccharopine dehydrogenase related protein n=1 Tax=Levilactobacillus senmaizukei DSM 21775 = NBRC 103853 TaxID=1423803 RepID=A0A0R2DFF5_9LACO|nr:saccharopine dehydrogenase related protein [Levilactobacillus senmaizukei DSM 21775 = NBRC 103853]